jgi:hypothetical protein
VARGETSWAARLTEQHFDELFYLRGERATVQRWLSALPAELIRSRPRLLVAATAMADSTGDVDAVDGLLDAAERASADAADEPFEPSAGRAASLLVNVPATIAIFRAYRAAGSRYLARLLRAFGQDDVAPGRGRTAAPAVPGLVEPFTPREIEVLGFARRRQVQPANRRRARGHPRHWQEAREPHPRRARRGQLHRRRHSRTDTGPDRLAPMAPSSLGTRLKIPPTTCTFG